MTPKYNEIFTTIPVPGKLMTRDAVTGKKLVDGVIFKPVSWEPSPEPAEIMLVDTGKSKVIGVDFDDEQSFNLALDIDPLCSYIAKGVGKGGGHFIYRAPEIPRYLREGITNPNGCNIPGLDLQMGRKLLLLATPANTTKQLLTEPISQYDDLTEMPLSMQAFVVSLYQTHKLKQVAIDTAPSATSSHRDSKLHFIVKETLESPDRYHHKLFTVVTTKSYKGIMEQNPKHPDMPYIPDNLPDGESGNKYLVSIATILGRDPSVDAEMFAKTMRYINSMFSSPYPADKLEGIISYISSGASKIDNVPVWQYDPDWNKTGMIYTDNYGNSHEVFSFNNKGSVGYLDHNHITNQIEVFNSAGSIIDTIKMKSSRNRSINKERLMDRVQNAELISTPLKDFGASMGEHGIQFNSYLRTEEQEILMEPSIYSNYQYPEVTIRFLENSLGKDRAHEFFLPFIKRKLITREFSPLIIVLWGPPHSGKSAITNGILRPFTKGRNMALSIEVAMEKFDDWKLNKDIVLVDEIHNTRKDLLPKLIQTMNTISGSSVITGIRAMQQSASSDEYPNTVTIFVTCNSAVQLSTEAQDRRLVICRSTQTASEALGMSDKAIEDAIRRESRDFAYYLATEIDFLGDVRYKSNHWLKDSVYSEFQGNSLPLLVSLVTAIANEDFAAFMEICLDHEIDMDKLVRCSHITAGRLQVRILNNNEHMSTVPALISPTMLDTAKLKAELKNLKGIAGVTLVDQAKGDKYSKNRKTVVNFRLNAVPQEFLDQLNDVVALEPLEE